MAWIEKNFEEIMRPSIDKIYKHKFGENINIQRSDRNSKKSKLMFMDKHFAIDTILRFENGAMITIQEKTLTHEKEEFNAFTIEYYNDPKIKDRGDWFKIAAQLYFFGYANKEENGYNKYWLISMLDFQLQIRKEFTIEEMRDEFLRENPLPAKASFFAIPFKILESLDGVVLDKRFETNI